MSVQGILQGGFLIEAKKTIFDDFKLRDEIMSKVYIFPPFFKKIAWTFTTIWILFCSYMIILMGLKFDDEQRKKVRPKKSWTNGQCEDSISFADRLDFGILSMSVSEGKKTSFCVQKILDKPLFIGHKNYQFCQQSIYLEI